MSPHLEELLASGQVRSAEIMRVDTGARPYLVTLWGQNHRKLAEAYGDRPNEALRNALGRLLTTIPPQPLPPSFPLPPVF
jgi:hypothetical protein